SRHRGSRYSSRSLSEPPKRTTGPRMLQGPLSYHTGSTSTFLLGSKYCTTAFGNFGVPVRFCAHGMQPRDREVATMTRKAAAVFLMESNAPVQARWANAQRAGPAPPNPPTVACNRLLGFTASVPHLFGSC